MYGLPSCRKGQLSPAQERAVSAGGTNLALLLGQLLVGREQLRLLISCWQLEHGDAVDELRHYGRLACWLAGWLAE